MAALAGWLVLIAAELVVLFGALRLMAMVLGPDLLPSLKVVLDMGAMLACGWTAGRVGRPHSVAAAIATAAGLTLFDFTPYIPLNVPWLLRLIGNSLRDSRYLSALSTAMIMHVLMFASLWAGAHLSRPHQAPLGLGFQR